MEWGRSIQESMDADDVSRQNRPVRPRPSKKVQEEESNDDLVVLVFPEGDFQVVPEGTTAADIIHQKVINQPKIETSLKTPFLSSSSQTWCFATLEEIIISSIISEAAKFLPFYGSG